MAPLQISYGGPGRGKNWIIQGPQGPQGPKGDTGDTGPQGIQGDPGPKGDTGDTGPQGIQGDPGPKGDTGDTGPQGIQGDPGPKGDTGDTGPQGIQGDPGPKGDTGDTGPQGIQGDPGPKGDTGDTGPQGIQGDPGPKGDTGDTGPQGIQGDPGPKGDTGATGAKGDKGDTGATGATGAQGPAGLDNVAVTLIFNSVDGNQTIGSGNFFPPVPPVATLPTFASPGWHINGHWKLESYGLLIGKYNTSAQTTVTFQLRKLTLNEPTTFQTSAVAYNGGSLVKEIVHTLYNSSGADRFYTHKFEEAINLDIEGKYMLFFVCSAKGNNINNLENLHIWFRLFREHTEG